MSRAYKVVDAFSAKPLLGNPVAVILNSEGLTDAEMQAVARWTNLSATTFVLSPTKAEADYRLRIFTPGGELPFAGHPTLGSAHAVLQDGRASPRDGKLVQECGVGLVAIHVPNERSGAQLTLDLPQATMSDLSQEDVSEIEAILGERIVAQAQPAIIDVGPRWIVAQLPSVDALLALTPNFARSAEFERRHRVTGLTVFAKRQSGGPALEVRSFSPSCGVNEDPVCGSGNGSVAVFQAKRGMLRSEGSHYEAAQGRCVGRDGRIAVDVDEKGNVRIGGACVTSANGVLEF